MKRFLFISLILISFCTQAQDAKELLRLYFNEVRDGNYPSIPNQFGLPEYANKVLNEIVRYEHDTSANVRSKAYSVIRFVGTKSRQPSVREKTVGKLVQAINDSHAGNVGTAMGYLTEFKREDFNKTSLDNIRSAFNKKPPHFDQLLRLIGFLNLTDLIENIRSYTTPGNSRGERWSAILALARMGDEAAIQDMMTRLKKLPINDDVIYEIFPDLVYTRQRVAFDYMIEILNSDEQNCLSPGEDERPVVCGFRVMEQLAPVVEGFPLELDESGDVKTDNYREALTSVRVWFAENRSYRILNIGY